MRAGQRHDGFGARQAHGVFGQKLGKGGTVQPRFAGESRTAEAGAGDLVFFIVTPDLIRGPAGSRLGGRDDVWRGSASQ